MKKMFLLLLVAFPLMAQNGRVYLKPLVNQPYDEAVTTYTKGQIDSVVWTRDPKVSAISFSAHWTDSVRLSNDSACWILRIVDNTLLTRTATDTLNWSATVSTTDGSSAPNTWANGKVLIGTPTYSPYADALVFRVKYSALGGQGTTTPTVRYRVQKIYSAGN